MVAIAGLVALIVRELGAKHPVVDLRVFRNRTYAVGVTLVTMMGFVLYGSLVLLPIMLQTLMAYPPLQAGIAMMPRGIGTLIATPIVGVLIAKTDARKLLGGGFLAGALTLYWLAMLDLNAGYWNLFWPQFIQGLAFGFLFVPLTTVSMDPISNEAMGNATSLFNLMRNLGGSIGIATVQTFIARQQQVHTTALSAHIDPYSPGAQHMLTSLQSAFMSRGSDAATALQQAYRAIGGIVQRQAAVLSFLDAFRIMAAIFLVITPLAILMKQPRRRNGGPRTAAAE